MRNAEDVYRNVRAIQKDQLRPKIDISLYLIKLALKSVFILVRYSYFYNKRD